MVGAKKRVASDGPSMGTCQSSYTLISFLTLKAIFRCPIAAGTWRSIIRLICTTFYPCPPVTEHQLLHALLSSGAIDKEKNPSTKRFGYSNPGPPRFLPASSCYFLLYDYLHALINAPSGIWSQVKYFHKAMSSFRANATMPIRRIRPVPAPKRF